MNKLEGTYPGCLTTVDELKMDTITFGSNVGVLSWSEGKFDFEGDATESAKVFITALSEMGIAICADKDKRIAELEQELFEAKVNQMKELEKDIAEIIKNGDSLEDLERQQKKRDLEQQAKGVEYATELIDFSAYSGTPELIQEAMKYAANHFRKQAQELKKDES